MKILMVCLGNICRSPIAEGVMQSILKKYNLNGLIDSAGVLSMHAGEAPDERATKVAAKYGVDISKQQARQIKKSDFSDFDLILTMDPSVHQQIKRLTSDPEQSKKIQLFLEYAGNSASFEVPDPYFGGPEGFELAYSMIEDACEKIALKIK